MLTVIVYLAVLLYAAMFIATIWLYVSMFVAAMIDHIRQKRPESAKHKHKYNTHPMTPVEDLFEESEWEWRYAPPTKSDMEDSSVWYIWPDNVRWRRRKPRIVERT